MSKRTISRTALKIFLVGLISLLGLVTTAYADDWDGDGVSDQTDIDIDNDGIPNVYEALNCELVPNPSFGSAQGPTGLNGADPDNPEQGDQFLYAGVYSGVDAIITVEEVVNANVENLDVTNLGEDAWFQPNVSYSSAYGYAQFAIQFVKAGTSTPIPPDTFFVTATDNDDGEVVGFDNSVATSIHTDNPTYEQQISIWSGYTTYQGDPHQAGIGSDPRFEISAVYVNTNVIRYRVSFDGTTGSQGRWHALIANPCRMRDNWNNPPLLLDEADSDHDGVPDYHDLDSDNDGIYDIVEAGNGGNDMNGDGRTDNPVGNNGLDDSLETDDTTSADINYAIPDTDGDGYPNHLDLDSDNDGCSDADEAYRDPLADGGDNAYYGLGTPPNVDANGKVVDAAYDTGEVAAVTDSSDTSACDDGDGIPASIEDAGPNGGDGNGDGILDSRQRNVASIPDASGSGSYVTLEIAGSTCNQITNMQAMTEADIGVDDPDYVYPVGLVGFTLTCGSAGQSADVKFYWHGISSIDYFRKYGSDVPGANNPYYKDYSVSLSTAVVGGISVPVTEYTLTDNQPGDETDVEAAIIDPAGPAIERSADASATADLDNDGVPNYLDLDDDNDGIPDMTEDCEPFESQNYNGAWVGQTPANLSVSTNMTYYDNFDVYRVVANQYPYHFANYLRSTGGTKYVVYEFDQPVPVNEILVMVIDVDGEPYSATMSVSGGTADLGDFHNFGNLDYDSSTGEMSISGGCTSGCNNTASLVGISDRTVSRIEIQVSKQKSGDYVSYVLYGKKICDTDGDGHANTMDLDSDNDGIADLVEAGGTDSDNNGLVDNFTDVDQDGLNDAQDDIDNGSTNEISNGTPLPDPDSDSDGIKDRLDLDSDNDGIPDAVEAQPTNGYQGNDGDVSDDVNIDGIPPYGLVVPQDTDSDNTPDYIDVDSDNDGTNDIDESGLTLSGTDNDGDGIDDAINASYQDPDGDINDPLSDLRRSSYLDEVDYRLVLAKIKGHIFEDITGDALSDGDTNINDDTDDQVAREGV
ncbi:MAG: hypothetical protein GXN93_02780, partial [Candidatus Diapherotrites archaeon]|nr:hypothetical protein [Candidatus Diapherotrites archaeon]